MMVWVWGTQLWQACGGSVAEEVKSQTPAGEVGQKPYCYLVITTCSKVFLVSFGSRGFCPTGLLGMVGHSAVVLSDRRLILAVLRSTEDCCLYACSDSLLKRLLMGC